MRSHLLFLFLLSISIFQLPAQQRNFELIATHTTDAYISAIDKFGNGYVAGRNKLQKFSPDGKLLYPYEEFRYGAIGSIDVTNPLKIVVFFPDVMKAVMLDKFLSPLSTYDFLQLGYPTVSAVCGSTDGRIWYFDNVSRSLKKIDETGKVLREGQPMNTQLAKTPLPNFMLEYDNVVFMNDSSQGIFVFDVFGSYKKTIPVKGLGKFQAVAQTIIYSNAENLYAFDMVTLATKTLALPENNSPIIQAAIGKDLLILLKAQKAEFYLIK